MTATLVSRIDPQSVAFLVPSTARQFTLRIDAGRGTFPDARWTRKPAPVSTRFAFG